MEKSAELIEIGRQLALAGIKIGAIKIRPNDPFTWASGWRSPIYNDNRMFLYYPEYRKLILNGLHLLCNTLWNYNPGVIAGTSTAGIPHAYGLAERLGLPNIYVRDKPKDHGMRNQIEGIDAEKGLERVKVLLIEDLISTGGSSVKAVQAIRDADGQIDLCLSIFSYGFPHPKAMFNGEAPFDKSPTIRLEEPCHVDSILQYPLLLEVATEENYISTDQRKFLEYWSTDPEEWSNEYKALHHTGGK